jgi:hypothetical protein
MNPRHAAALALVLLTVSVASAQSQLQIKPNRLSKPTLEIPPAPIPKSVAPTPKAPSPREALLAPFVGCWISTDTEEIVESRTPTGTLPLPSAFVTGTVSFCWRTRDDGTIYFQPPADGNVPVSDAWRQQGAISVWMHWTTGEVDPSSHRVNFELENIVRFQNNTEHESEERYSCLPEGSEIECIVEGIYNQNHQPHYKEVDHFHMHRMD